MRADSPPPGHDRNTRKADARARDKRSQARDEQGGRRRGGKKPSSARSGWKIFGLVLATPIALGLAGLLAIALAAILAASRLPPLDVLTDYRPKVPMHVYSADGLLIGEFGEERRNVVRIVDFPAKMKQAIIAAEDDSFFEHSGVDIKGIARAALANFRAGVKAQGASTITMQVARNFFLSRERSYVRKVYEVLLSWKIEHALTKDQILEIYANQIFLGQRSFGFGTAASTYFGKPLHELSLAQMAMLAGLPKAPSAYNPIVNPKRARERQHYVLGRMQALGFITAAENDRARNEDIRVVPERGPLPLDAQFAAEMARQMAYDMYKDEAYTGGLDVYTTIVAKDQVAANKAVRRAVVDFDRKHGYRGPEAYIELPADAARREDGIRDAVAQAGDAGEFLSAVVLKADPRAVTITRGRDITFDITGDGLKFVGRWLNPKNPADRQIRRGAIVRVAEGSAGWEITQTPEVESSFISVDTDSGAVRSLVGGFDWNRSKFNRVTQSVRQPGSSFKPFIYSAALEKGFMASTIVNDAPIILDPATTGGQLWEPKNYDGKYDGALSLRSALARSKNMVSIRILQSIGVDYAQDYVSRFGFVPEKNPAYLTMALGAGAVTPWQLSGAISVFANGGYRIQPYLVDRIVDQAGNVLAKANPMVAGNEEHRAIDARNAFIIDSMLKDVVNRGTATEAKKQLKRNDLAGKTGTTNDAFDAWFVGYGAGIAGVAWVGYDTPRSLGERETGGGLALPIWISYMRAALDKKPEASRTPPQGVVKIADEWYMSEITPGQGIGSLGVTEDGLSTGEKQENVRDQIF